MTKRGVLWNTVPVLLLAGALVVLSGCSKRGDAAIEIPLQTETETEITIETQETPVPTKEPALSPMNEAAASPTPAPTPEPTPDPEPLRDEWTLSFAGDCTIGTLHAWQRSPTPVNMLYVMDGDWGYPFSNVADLFFSDDFTMVNLEGTFTERTAPKGKAYCFKAPPEAAETLLRGGIEAVSLANNHSRDYGEQSLNDTCAALEAKGILWADEGIPIVFDLPDGGPRLGVIAYNCVESALPPGDVDAYMEACAAMYEACEAAGCELIFAFVHWGWEYRTEPEEWMREFAGRLCALGCDMILGSHPHVLQRFELLEGTPICYSLGNFCFGGHSGPTDMDSVIVRQGIRRTRDGYALGETQFLPCAISSTPGRNDFRPMLYGPDEAGYRRVLEKLRLDNTGELSK